MNTFLLRFKFFYETFFLRVKIVSVITSLTFICGSKKKLESSPTVCL